MGSVKGVNETIKEIRKFGKDAEKIIAFETEAIARQIEKDAKIKAPVNFGKLQQSISTLKVNPLKYKVTVNELYGAYIEFGTGKKVQVPAEFKDMANSFRGQKMGTFKQGLEAIKAWCRAKGIDEKAAYPIDSLYPAWVKGKKDYLNNLIKIINKLNKKV
jgi:hypothetical protein